MNKPLHEVFTINCVDTYNQLLKEVASRNEVLKINHNTSKDTFQQTALDILNSYMRQPHIRLEEGPYKAQHETLNLPINVADGLIGNGFTFSMSSSTTPINHVWYEIPYKGDFNALKSTVSYNRRFFQMEFLGNNIVLHFFTQKTLQEAAEQIKTERDAIVDIINGNQADIDEFWKSKKDILLTQIKSEIEKKYDAEMRKNDLNNLLS
ncbi:MAG: hypothetical protein K2Q33_01930 [Gammaproteobacteria bacterium]|nr:hypothetical protein [Gammaproteobacteria bacterium]